MGRPAKYPEEFRREAVELYRSSDRSRAEVAKSLGIADGSLAAWVKAIEASEVPGALDADERAELGSAAAGERRTCGWTARSSARQPPISHGRRPGELCRFVSDHAGEYPVKRLCQLVEVPRSSYYEWSTRPLSDHYLDDAWLANEIYDIHVASRRTYGAPRVRASSATRGRCHAASGSPGSWPSAASSARTAAGSGAGARPTPPRPGPAGAGLHRRAFRSALGRGHHRVRVLGRQALPRRDQGPPRPGPRRLVDGRTPDHRPRRRRPRHGAGPARARRRAAASRRPRDANTHRSSSRTGSPTGTSTRPTARPATATTTPRWKRPGRRSSGRSATSGGPGKQMTRSQLRTILFDYIEVFYNRQRHQARLGHRTPAEAYAASRAA